MKKTKFRVEPSPELKKFLLKKKVYRKFMKNLKGGWNDLDNNHTVRNFLGAFIFSETPEGINFWYDLEDEFNNKVRTS
jgi:hypothetical protein